jgi:hypothetical protein
MRRLASGARRLIEAEFDINCNTERRRALFRSAGRSSCPVQEAG